MTNDTIRCDRLDELLPEYLEETLAPDTRSAVEAHLAGCARCGSIVADLNAITTAAGGLPDLEPSRDLWSGIAGRIAAPVISLTREPDARTTRRDRVRLFAAAAALVVMSAGATFLGTRYWMQQSQPARVASDPGPTILGPGNGAPSETGSEPRATGSDTLDTGPVMPDESREAPPRRPVAARRAPAPAPTRVGNVSRTSAELAYDREIQQLKGLLEARRAELDPSTVAVVERNLNVIDDAIRQSREALQRDPASRFLNDQLNSALDKKVELLRAAAMLPSRS